MNNQRGKQFYHNFIDLNTNVDGAARAQRNTYDSNLRDVPQPAQEKLLQTQNAIMRQKVAEQARKIKELESKQP